MKKILKYTVAVMAVTGLVANAELINLTDPSLEAAYSGTGGVAESGWFTYGDAIAAVDVSPGSHWAPAGMTNLDGSKATLIVQNAEDDGGNIYQTVELDAGVTYRLTVGLGTSSWIGKNDAKFQVLFFQGGIAASTTGVIAANTGAFADYSVEITPTVTGDFNAGIRNMGYVPSTGADNNESTLIVDNVRLEVVPEPATLGLVAVFGGAVLFIRRRLMI